MGYKWRPAALKHVDIMGHVQQGKRGFELTAHRPAWSKASAAEPRRIVVKEVRHHEQVVRWTKVVLFDKQGQWIRWDSIERGKLSWKDLWSMESKWVSFIFRAKYDVFPTLVNLQQW